MLTATQDVAGSHTAILSVLISLYTLHLLHLVNVTSASVVLYAGVESKNEFGTRKITQTTFVLNNNGMGCVVMSVKGEEE